LLVDELPLNFQKTVTIVARVTFLKKYPIKKELYQFPDIVKYYTGYFAAGLTLEQPALFTSTKSVP